MMQYQVVRSENIQSKNAISHLELQVRELIKNGWEPLGGISVIQSFTDSNFSVTKVYQAMIKR